MRGLEVALRPETEQRLRQRHRAFLDVEPDARQAARSAADEAFKDQYAETAGEPRRAFLLEVLDAVEAGERRVDIAAALGVTRQRVDVYVAEARDLGA